jgi:SET domain-containing protein
MSKTTKPNKLYKLSRSGIHNRGLFAAEDIAQDTKIIEYIGERITKKEAQARALAKDASAKKSGSGRVYIFELNSRYDIDGNVANNLARYINHSCDPNCEAVNIRGHIWIVSTRPIKKDEELSFDYGYDSEHFLDHPCYCKASNCFGFIVKADQRKKLKSLIKKKEIKTKT